MKGIRDASRAYQDSDSQIKLRKCIPGDHNLNNKAIITRTSPSIKTETIPQKGIIIHSPTMTDPLITIIHKEVSLRETTPLTLKGRATHKPNHTQTKMHTGLNSPVVDPRGTTETDNANNITISDPPSRMLGVNLLTIAKTFYSP